MFCGQGSFKTLLKRVFKNLEDVEDSVPDTVKTITKAKEVSLEPSILSHAVGFVAELAVKTGVSRERKALLAVLKGLVAEKQAVCIRVRCILHFVSHGYTCVCRVVGVDRGRVCPWIGASSLSGSWRQRDAVG
jgi:hypothetical protein